MRTRIAVTVGLWSAMVVATFTLFHGAAAPLGLALSVVGVVLAAGATRGRWVGRFRPSRGAVASGFPPGPRRVPLAETGIVLPR